MEYSTLSVNQNTVSFVVVGNECEVSVMYVRMYACLSGGR